MITSRNPWPPLSLRCDQTGFTLLESTIAVLLVGVLMVAALRSVSGVKQREMQILNELRGQQLAVDLLNEILLQSYAESVTASMFGPEPGETGNRSLFDDVDDYHGWSATPPKDRSGNIISGFSGWTQAVTVEWANPQTLAPTTFANTGLKRMSVTVSKDSRVIASAVGYRSIAWMDTLPTPSSALQNHAPIAVATSPSLNRRTTETVSFSATGSSDFDGDGLSYVWSFGDGSTDTGPAVSHRYAQAGTYSCTLTVYDGAGGIGIASLIAVISP